MNKEPVSLATAIRKISVAASTARRDGYTQPYSLELTIPELYALNRHLGS